MNLSYATMSDIECPIVKSDSTCYWKDMWRKLDGMRRLWQLCDVSLVTEDNRVFKAHSPVLAASSNVFHSLLIGQKNYNGIGEEIKLLLKNVSSDVMEVTLDFIYGITPSKRQSFEMLQTGATEFGIRGAFEYCSQRLKKMANETLVMDGENADSLLDEVSYSSRGENLTCPQRQVTLTSSVSDVESERYGSDLGVIPENRNSGTSDVQNGVPQWSVNGLDPAAEKNFQDLSSELTDSADKMPDDEIHTAIFTQMSLVDLTAGIKCPHIKGIMGDDNPMNSSFLAEDELVVDAVKERSPGVESDFDDVQQPEEHKVDFSAPMPPKKRKITSDVDEIGSYRRGGTNLEKNPGNCCDAPDTHKNTSIRNGRSDADFRSCFASSDFSSPCSSSSALLADFPAKCSDVSVCESSVLLKVPTNCAALTNLVPDDSKLVSENPACELLPGCDSFLYPCSTTEGQDFQTLVTDINSELSFVNQNLLPKPFSFNVKDSLYSTDLTRSFSDVLLATQTPSFSTTPYVTSTTASSSSFQRNQMMETGWKEPDIWSAYNPKSTVTMQNNSLCSTSRSNWQTVPNVEPYSSQNTSRLLGLMQESVPSLSNTTVSCKTTKVFASLDNASICERSSYITPPSDVTCTVPLESGEILSYSFLGPSQGTVPSSLIRSQPIEICPSVADVSVPGSTCVDEGTKHALHGSSSAKNLEPEEGSSLTRQNTFQCNTCNKAFKTAGQLNGHKKRTHFQQDVVSTSSGAKHTVTHKCQYCEETFKSSYKLQTHQLKVHSKGKLFSCQDCSFRSPRKKDVQAHMLSQHGRAPSGVKVYSCSSCNYKCIDRNRFEEHEAKHTGITNHCCPLCNRAYTTKRGMRTHLKYHSDERPHKCDICGAAFKVTSKLSDHMKLIHIQKGVKPYKCGYCDHATALRGNCNQHIRKNHPGQPLHVIDKFASQRKCVKDYDYAGMAGEGIEEHRNLEAARSTVRKATAAST